MANRIRHNNINTPHYWNEVYKENVARNSTDAYSSLLKLMRKFVDFSNPMCMVDVACGEGSGINFIYQELNKQHVCIGLDHSEVIVSRNKERYPEVLFIEFDVDQHVFANIRTHTSNMDMICFSIHSLEHITNYEPHLKHFLNFCKFYFVVVPYDKYFSDCAEHINRFDERTMSQFNVAHMEHYEKDMGPPGFQESIIYALKGAR